MSLKTDAARPKLLTPNQKKNLKSPAAGRAKSAEKQVMPFTAKELQLIKACESGQVDNVYELLWNNADVNTQMPHSGSSPLLVACQTGNTQIASILISFGAKIKVTDDYGVSTLHWAANSGQKKLVSMILEKGSLKNSDLSRRDCFGSTPLHFASVRNKQDVISQLVEAGCDPFTTNNDGRKPSDLTTDESIKMYLLDEESKIIANKAKIGQRANVAEEDRKAARKSKKVPPALPRVPSPPKDKNSTGSLRSSKELLVKKGPAPFVAAKKR